MGGVYIHIPFCRKACAYCDFHFSVNTRDRRKVVSAIAFETGLRKDHLTDKNLRTIYFGGGTPSLLEASELHELMQALSGHFTWHRDAEITLEANPEDVTKERLREWSAAGVNRLSIGLQSFDDRELAWMNRAHTSDEAAASVKRAQDEGFTNVSIDLIYGSRFQTLESWRRTLETALALDPLHISAYHLTVEKRTRLGSLVGKGAEPSIDQATGGDMFLLMHDLLGEHGFEHYEVSNFAKPGRRSQHNSAYWQGHQYLGLGPSAHSFDGINRQWNVASNTRYVQLLERGEKWYGNETLTTRDRYNEYVMTSLRTIEGCDPAHIEARIGKRYADAFIRHARREPRLTWENGRFRLRREAMLFADAIASACFVLEEIGDDRVAHLD
jgi:oxygen-independent coproporphyrinogen III oxidase